jgi:hypothetical protein
MPIVNDDVMVNGGSHSHVLFLLDCVGTVATQSCVMTTVYCTKFQQIALASHSSTLVIAVSGLSLADVVAGSDRFEDTHTAAIATVSRCQMCQRVVHRLWLC